MDGRPPTIHLCGTATVSLSEVDRQLLQRCLDAAPRAWQDFADRFLGLVVHVANHAAESRGMPLDHATRDDLVAEVFLTLVRDDFAVLRRFRRNCSLATYVTVIARRVIVRRLVAHRAEARGGDAPLQTAPDTEVSEQTRMENREEVERLLNSLGPKEAGVVRMYHLDGKSYQEISRITGMAENSIGSLLSRARVKMRQQSDPA